MPENNCYCRPMVISKRTWVFTVLKRCLVRNLAGDMHTAPPMGCWCPAACQHPCACITARIDPLLEPPANLAGWIHHRLAQNMAQIVTNPALNYDLTSHHHHVTN
jgi:hypothetical protein